MSCGAARLPWAKSIVSLWLTERLNIYLGQREVAIARYRRGWGDRPFGEAVARVEGAGWRAAVAALAGLLEEGQVAGGVARVALGGELASALIVPWQAQLHGRQDREDYARHLHARTFGEAATGLDVVLGTSAYGRAAPAFFVDRALLAALGTMFTGRGVRLRCVTPLLVATFNRFRREFSAVAGGVLVLSEPRCVQLALLQGDAWIDLRARRTTDAAGDVAQTLRREITTLPLEPARVYLVEHTVAAGLDEVAGIPVNRLRLARQAAPGLAALL